MTTMKKTLVSLLVAVTAFTVSVVPAQAQAQPLVSSPTVTASVVVDTPTFVVASSRGKCGWWLPFLWLRLYWGATGRCF